jgi:hypothetical protein
MVQLYCRELELINFMGNTELVHSNVIGVIEAACIEGVTSPVSFLSSVSDLGQDKCSIRQLDDQGLLEKHVTTASWFCRLTLTMGQGKPKLKVSQLVACR